MPEIPKKSDEQGSEDNIEDDLPSQQKFLAIVYSCAFLLSLGNGFLGSRTSFVAVNWFAGAQCDNVDAAKCDDRIPLSCICKAALTRYATVSSATSFASVGFAVCIIPFLTRLSDAFGRRIFIQVMPHSSLAVSFEESFRIASHVPAPKLNSHGEERWAPS